MTAFARIERAATKDGTWAIRLVSGVGMLIGHDVRTEIKRRRSKDRARNGSIELPVVLKKVVKVVCVLLIDFGKIELEYA